MSVVAAVIGTAVSIFSAADAGRKANRAAKNNEKAQKRAAAEILRRAKVNAQFILEEGEVLSGSQVSAFARSGVDVGSGSPLTVAEETISRSFRDAEEEITQGRMSGGTLLTQARADRSATAAAGRAGTIGAVGGGIATIGSALSDTNAANKPSGGK